MNKLRSGFSKPELLFVIIVLTGLVLISYANYQNSLSKSRDSQRRNGVSLLADALEEYFYDNDRYPPADIKMGLIVACGNNAEKPEPCKWGDKLGDYIELPNDPLPRRNFFYQVSTDGAKFKIWAAMEVTPSVDLPDKSKIPSCGDVICNWAQASEEK
jgi:type II secretory pathway pseudopilin PulG